jgi:hypothetical protein
MKRTLFFGICILALMAFSFTQDKWYEVTISKVSEPGKTDGIISVKLLKASASYTFSIYEENKGPWDGFDPLFTSGEISLPQYDFKDLAQGKYLLYIQLSEGEFAGEPVTVN